MKRRMTLSLVLTLSVLLSLLSMPSTAQAAPPQRFSNDSGVVTPGMSQVLRITVNGTGGNDAIRVRIRWMQYASQGCSGMPPVCRHMVVSQGATPVETLSPDDALSVDVDGTGNGVRVLVFSNREVRVNAMIIDVATGKVVAFRTSLSVLGDG